MLQLQLGEVLTLFLQFVLALLQLVLFTFVQLRFAIERLFLLDESLFRTLNLGAAVADLFFQLRSAFDEFFFGFQKGFALFGFRFTSSLLDDEASRVAR